MSPAAIATAIGSDASKVTKSASSPASAKYPLARAIKVGECEASGSTPIWILSAAAFSAAWAGPPQTPQRPPRPDQIPCVSITCSASTGVPVFPAIRHPFGERYHTEYRGRLGCGKSAGGDPCRRTRLALDGWLKLAHSPIAGDPSPGVRSWFYDPPPYAHHPAAAAALRLSVYAAPRRRQAGAGRHQPSVLRPQAPTIAAVLVKDSALLLAIHDEAKAKGGVGGYTVEALVLDDGTVTCRSEYDPAQAALACPQGKGSRSTGRRRGWAAEQRQQQGDGADPEPGRSGDDLPFLDSIRTSPIPKWPRNSIQAAARSISAS